jgi:hypothetical protein
MTFEPECVDSVSSVNGIPDKNMILGALLVIAV